MLGKIVDPELIAELQYEKPAWLRFMDLSAVQASYENDFSRRVRVTSAYYPGSSGPAMSQIIGLARSGVVSTTPTPVSTQSPRQRVLTLTMRSFKASLIFRMWEIIRR